MNKHIVNINGHTFVFFLKGRRLDVFMYNKGIPQKIDFRDFKYQNKIKENLHRGILQMFKSEILADIRNKKINSFDEVKNELKRRLDSIDNKEIKDIIKESSSTDEYREVLKYLDEAIKKQAENLDVKKEMIEASLDIDLRELFERNGISEYEISPSKHSTLIVYKGKNGIPHTIINNNPNMTVYDVIVKNLQFDYIHSDKELDSAISDVMEREGKLSFTQNKTVNVNNVESYMDEIINYIKKTRTDISKIYGVKPADDTIDGALLLETDKGLEPIIVTKNNYGKLSVDFPNKKAVDSKDIVTTEIKKDNTKNVTEERLNVISNDNQIRVIFKKLDNNGSIFEDEKNSLKTFITETFNKISGDDVLTEIENDFLVMLLETNLRDKIVYQIPEARDICDELINSYTENDNLEKTDDKVKKLEKQDEKNAFIELTVVTFISGLVTGLFVYAFFKMFI